MCCALCFSHGENPSLLHNTRVQRFYYHCIIIIFFTPLETPVAFFFFQSHHLLLRRNSPDNCKLSQTEQLEHGTREQVPSPKLVLKNPASIQSCILSPPHLFSLAERPFIRSTLLSLPSFPLRYNKAFGQLHFCGVSLSHLHLAKSSSTTGSP